MKLGIKKTKRNIIIDKIFKQIYDTYYSYLKAYSFMIVKNKFIAEEIVNECLYKLLTKLEKQKINYIKQWLYICVKRASFTYLKKHKVIFEYYDELVVDDNNNFKIKELKNILTYEEYTYIHLYYVYNFSKQKIQSIMKISKHKLQKLSKNSLNKIKSYYLENYIR